MMGDEKPSRTELNERRYSEMVRAMVDESVQAIEGGASSKLTAQMIAMRAHGLGMALRAADGEDSERDRRMAELVRHEIFRIDPGWGEGNARAAVRDGSAVGVSEWLAAFEHEERRRRSVQPDRRWCVLECDAGGSWKNGSGGGISHEEALAELARRRTGRRDDDRIRLGRLAPVRAIGRARR